MAAGAPFQLVPPAKGTLLIASPRLLADAFVRTVVLLVAHDETGSLGVVVNRPDERRGSFGLPTKVPLWNGGPVARDDGFQFLHALGDDLPGADEVLPGVWIGGDEMAVRDLLATMEPRLVAGRVLCGYAGWSAGQLQGELEQGAWVVRPGTAELVFHAEPETVWRRSLAELGPTYAEFAQLPADTRLN